MGMLPVVSDGCVELQDSEQQGPTPDGCSVFQAASAMKGGRCVPSSRGSKAKLGTLSSLAFCEGLPWLGHMTHGRKVTWRDRKLDSGEGKTEKTEHLPLPQFFSSLHASSQLDDASPHLEWGLPDTIG